MGADPGLVHHLLAGGNTQGSGVLPISSFFVQPRGRREGWRRDAGVGKVV